MKSFSNFCKQDSQKKETQSQKNMQETYDELKDLDNDELTRRLYDEVKKQKENGTFDFSKLCDSVERLRDFVSPQTYNNMKSMLEKIR
jgi:hypothetical protein